MPSRFWPFLQQLLLLVGVYVLSIGPFYWHWYGSRFGLGSKATAVFYEPIVIVAQVVPGFGRWLDWYVGLWIS